MGIMQKRIRLLVQLLQTEADAGYIIGHNKELSEDTSDYRRGFENGAVYGLGRATELITEHLTSERQP